MSVLGSALAAFGIFSFKWQFGRPAWNTGNQIEIAIGVAAAVWGAILRKDSRDI